MRLSPLRVYRGRPAASPMPCPIHSTGGSPAGSVQKLWPQSLEALRGISGIGEKKLERYGAEVLRLVAEPAA